MNKIGKENWVTKIQWEYFFGDRGKKREKYKQKEKSKEKESIKYKGS